MNTHIIRMVGEMFRRRELKVRAGGKVGILGDVGMRILGKEDFVKIVHGVDFVGSEAFRTLRFGRFDKATLPSERVGAEDVNVSFVADVNEFGGIVDVNIGESDLFECMLKDGSFGFLDTDVTAHDNCVKQMSYASFFQVLHEYFSGQSAVADKCYGYASGFQLGQQFDRSRKQSSIL